MPSLVTSTAAPFSDLSYVSSPILISPNLVLTRWIGPSNGHMRLALAYLAITLSVSRKQHYCVSLAAMMYSTELKDRKETSLFETISIEFGSRERVQ